MRIYPQLPAGSSISDAVLKPNPGHEPLPTHN